MIDFFVKMMYNTHMIYERNGLLLPERTTPQIDSDLSESLRVALGGPAETYKDLELSNEKKEVVTKAWHNHQNADLLVEEIDAVDLDLKKNALVRWKQELLAKEDLDPLVKQLYRWKVNEHIANVNILIASKNGDMNSFRRWNEFIYDTPDEDIYRGALDWVANDADTLLAVTDQNPSIIEAAEEVRHLLKDRRGYRELLAPDEKIFEAVRADHMRTTGFYGLLLASIDIPDKKITTEIGDPILERVLQNIGSTKPIVDATGSSWGASSRGIERPAIMNMPVKRFIGLGLGHEIGSHELERTNGYRGPLALAAEGLDRYESGNEGRAVIREQVPYETFEEFGKIVRWRDILRRHIAISFAVGVGEARPASSSETYDFINTIDRMYQTQLKPNEPDVARAAARKKTDALLLNVLKGTDGQGGAYLKNKVYLEGHVANWLTAALKGPASISEGDLGKFDINNARHIHALQAVGLLPEQG